MAMKKIKTLEMVRVNAGVLKLTESQTEHRMHLLEKEGSAEGVFKVKEGCVVEFKKGEEFRYGGEIPKVWIDTKVELVK